MSIILYLLLFISICFQCNGKNYSFPENFKFGVATSSYQVEGAWNISGKGENIWDSFTHNKPELIKDGSNGDIACDTYHKTKEDVKLLKQLGVNFYRFSLSWSRILPTGYSNIINEDGIRYYNELIDELLANNIEPLVTLYHWDLPQPLQEIGGWPNPLLSDIFADYAEIVFEKFGDRVKNWLTINEPYVVCELGYSYGFVAPAQNSAGIGGYLCAHTVLLAHAKAYRLYDKKFRNEQKGKVAITLDSIWYEPLNTDEKNLKASETSTMISFGWFVHPIFSKTGDYPSIMRQRIDQLSKGEGFKKSRLPVFTASEIELIKGSADYLGINHYTSRYVVGEAPNGTRPSHSFDRGASLSENPEWEQSTTAEWLLVVPYGIRKLLNWVKNNFDNPEVLIGENGYADKNSLQDCRRINYYNKYLEQVLLAIHEDGCNVTGYTAWSFLDNFEWIKGFTARFGIYHVDFNDPERKRTPKMSAGVYQNIIKTRSIDWNYVPENHEACTWN